VSSETTFIQQTSLFSYSGTSCLRNDYYHNDCSLCMDICPKGAFHIVRNKLTLFENECVDCAACIGSCPTEALHIDNFDPNAYTSSFTENENKILSCKSTTPCLGVFDAHHLIAMALRSEEAPACDMAHCEGCSLNTEGIVERSIRKKIAEANRFFEETGYEACIQTREEKPEENERRALFRKAFEGAKEAVIEGEKEELSMTKEYQKRIDTHQPLKLLLLKNALKENMDKFAKTSFDHTSPLFFEKTIDFNACTNCGDCVQFCPTQALQATSDKQGIYFIAGNCVGCGICDHICKPDAITTKEGFDLVTIAYDRAEELVHYEMVMCHECRCPYPYKGGDPICDRCKDFKSDFENMFTMAKDL